MQSMVRVLKAMVVMLDTEVVFEKAGDAFIVFSRHVIKILHQHSSPRPF